MELAKKTTRTVIVPIVEESMIRSTVGILHSYFNFNKLPREFFRIPKPALSEMVFSEDPFDL